ncbi:MAG: DUF3987 domain-containing protein [Planctomycetota bacterium]
MKPFLEQIFGDAISPDRQLVVFCKPSNSTAFFDSISDAVEHVRTRMATENVYYGVGLMNGVTRGRGKAENVAAIGGLWADVDLAFGPHRGKCLPTSVDDVMRLVGRLGLRPTVIVFSGHGVHLYWLFKEPWIFDTDTERDRAASLAKRWHRTVCARAEEMGWHLENLGDLARVLRLPGTQNHWNGTVEEVRVLEADYDQRYNPDSFSSYLVEEEPAPEEAQIDNLVLRPDAEPPAAKLLKLAGESSKFWQTWHHQRTDLSDTSQSGYDLSLATIAALGGWSDQEIADLIIAARRNHNEKPEKALRPDYMARTIARARRTADERPTESADVDLSAFSPPTEARKPDNRPADPGPFPDHLLDVPGFIADVMRYNLETAFRPQPSLALAGAVCLQSVLAARKVRDAYGNRTNLYAIAVAGSGSGKDHARKVNKDILFASGFQHLEGNEDVASDAGLVAAVEQQPAVLFLFDEFGRFLRTIGDPRRAPHLFNVLSCLMKLYSSADTVYRGKAYADPKRNRIIDQPCVSVYGTTVPGHFYEALTADSLNDGFLARLLVFEALPIPERQLQPKRPVPADIVDTARWWGEFSPDGNLQKEHPEPLVVERTDEANDVFADLAAVVDTELGKKRSEGRSLWARAEEKACRLALAYACSADRENPVIDADAARWACQLAEYVTRRVLWRATLWISDGRFDAKQKKVLRIIRDSGGEISHSDLYARTRSFTLREREEVIENMVATGQIDRVSIPTATKPRVVYVAL